MTRSRETNKPTRESPFGHGLSAYELRKVDVEVFSKMYGRRDPEAAQDLIDLGVDGGEIDRRRGDGFGGKVRRSRADVAREYFAENIGQSTRQKIRSK